MKFMTTEVNGLDIFYREAGPADGPVVLLLHGFPTSSWQFRNLIPLLADKYRVIAPDYPGFGHSASPDRADFDYTFANYADLMHGLLDQLGVDRYAFYAFDYGAPTGYRLALQGPERVTAMIVQNGNAYEEGLLEFWNPIKAYWAEDTPEKREGVRPILSEETTEFQYTHGVADRTRLDPDAWLHDITQLARPGNDDIQLDLFKDYGTNVGLYPRFQEFFRTHRPPTLIVWGQNDYIFPPEGAHPYLKDLPDAELHLLDTGHFLLEDQLDAAGPLIRDFLDRSL
ncbi:MULTISPECIES: alpha/beta hydrolase [Actinoplanes]|uniref:alpha/beta fold hydrolase n=1 Tax=Actinoplanes TaxID=1865 RepID=UPI0005F2CB53|nr:MULTISPECIES: alpha/beta hydrolase [Actinoplanes]GLY02458.1 alpha/beta hydrolase [Actinoplanes sp. NBRC 101535]